MIKLEKKNNEQLGCDKLKRLKWKLILDTRTAAYSLQCVQIISTKYIYKNIRLISLFYRLAQNGIKFNLTFFFCWNFANTFDEIYFGVWALKRMRE